MKGEKQSKGRTTNREENIYLTWGWGGVSIQTILYNVCMIMVDDDDTL